MNDPTPMITRCKLCMHYIRSDEFGCWFCDLMYHPVESPKCGCTWGEEEPDDGR